MGFFRETRKVLSKDGILKMKTNTTNTWKNAKLYQSKYFRQPEIKPSLTSQHFDLIILLIFRAAFQFGIKMQEGRKTRSRPGGMSEKQKLDREWQQISNVNYFITFLHRLYYLNNFFAIFFLLLLDHFKAQRRRVIKQVRDTLHFLMKT